MINMINMACIVYHIRSLLLYSTNMVSMVSMVLYIVVLYKYGKYGKQIIYLHNYGSEWEDRNLFVSFDKGVDELMRFAHGAAKHEEKYGDRGFTSQLIEYSEKDGTLEKTAVWEVDDRFDLVKVY